MDYKGFPPYKIVEYSDMNEKFYKILVLLSKKNLSPQYISIVFFYINTISKVKKTT